MLAECSQCGCVGHHITLNEGHGTPSHDQCGVKLHIDLCRYMLEVFWVQVLSVTFFLPIWG
jgi:hypothetical protein